MRSRARRKPHDSFKRLHVFMKLMFIQFSIDASITKVSAFQNRRIGQYESSPFPLARRSSLLSSSKKKISTVVSSSVAQEHKDENMGNVPLSSEQNQVPVCRVVASSDRKLPSNLKALPSVLPIKTSTVDKLDSIYHAVAHESTRRLRYLSSSGNSEESKNALSIGEEFAFVSTTRRSLEDAGFELLSQRDLDLCDALNAGYLLRLSIQPNLKRLDPSISKEFYPELFDKGKPIDPNSLLFDGRVLVYWRGYDKEVSKGRLLLPKIDYLQARLVQGAAYWIKNRFDSLERAVYLRYLVSSRRFSRSITKSVDKLLDRVPDERLAQAVREKVCVNTTSFAGISTTTSSPGSMIKLSRYGGSRVRFVGSPDPNEALTPFVLCEDASGTCMPSSTKSPQSAFHGLDGGIGDRDVAQDIFESITACDTKCQYDIEAEKDGRNTPPSQLLERITLGNLVDFVSKQGRRQLLKTLFAKSELVEPTYKEVVVVWRPLPERNSSIPTLRPPKFVYDFADMFDIKGLPPTAKSLSKEKRPLAQIRSFSNVPMANLPAVLPSTKLIFRPADAFVFDLVSALSFLAVFGSLRFDSPKLDFIALLSVSFWLFRTIIRYSNKLARYDLLVKTFLTSKITHRNAGALKYIASEAGSQRASRAAIVHAWLRKYLERTGAEEESSDTLLRHGETQISALLSEQRQVRINVQSALHDLEDVGLIKKKEENMIKVVQDEATILSKLQRAWTRVFEGRLRMKSSAATQAEEEKEADVTLFE